ncbi:DEAD/DEAH box helicase [Robbsia sp. Bb-Pol-6]|uniref:DEAD/DEAH box helicase n=1 Tax=Robbsia betulipollinis TaxID=2981849 RepID=A0ABT3ZTF8_9BURK|nr:DEAD/DEAH box helicase [Robbsia betulipollinis]MCY0389813.1 DEAD/DEAH box helicase [Robbsia betulipollinis]
MSFPEIPYTKSQLLDSYGPARIRQAGAYARAVTDFHAGRGGLRARVQGEAPEPYRVEVLIEERDGAWGIDGMCSCAVQVNCEHVVAVLLAGLTMRTDASRRGPIRRVDVLPVPVLTLAMHAASGRARGYTVRPAGRAAYGTLSFDYAGIDVRPYSQATLLATADGTMVQITRHQDAERRGIATLLAAGMTSNATRPVPTHGTAVDAWYFADPAEWTGFVRGVVPELRRGGWQVRISADFPFDVTPVDEWSGSIARAPDGWFDLEMGILLDGHEVRLEPLLAELFRRDRRWLGGGLESIGDDEAVALRTGEGARLLLGAGRLKPVIRSLIDLFAAFGKDMARGRLRVDPRDLGRIAELTATGCWRFPEGESSCEGLPGGVPCQDAGLMPPPPGLNATLRTYQREGLDWLQCLRRRGMQGVLADDMGLGKTVQTLAHILTEKAEGRLDRPVLIVVPTTLVQNWRDEACRFAPGVSVLALQGPLRRRRFSQIGAHDVVITTYALLWRDHAVLSQHEYHFLILDEAQYIKNARSNAARAVRGLRARHRLCLTGTPIENHLGELWALFDFLMPGFLGNAREFGRYWRKPIEQDGDAVRLALLRCRIRPFLLRRHKDTVARELPAKTVIVRSVALEGAQRNFYETVRVAVRAKVRAAVAAQGAAHGHIAVLDALLKLRQVCCDPRLVRFDGAGATRQSAKLDHLMAMLPSLIAAGHRVLLFSQFTQMLALIATALEHAGLRYVTLTGATRDRATPVGRFQRGEVPLFLASLKAGGVGLNLTAADTVIHYDPWWNPASEAQATDRAHRLGQGQPVFVYKLIAAGTVEERIVALQERKATLAGRLLTDDGNVLPALSVAELDALLAPIPGMPGAAPEDDISL